MSLYDDSFDLEFDRFDDFDDENDDDDADDEKDDEGGSVIFHDFGDDR